MKTFKKSPHQPTPSPATEGVLKACQYKRKYAKSQYFF